MYICPTVYDACDVYSGRPIKSSEREIKGQAESFVIRSPYIRIPPDFKNFLKNGTNKTRLLEHTEDVWKGGAAALGSRVVYFGKQSTRGRLKHHRLETTEKLTNKSRRSRHKNLQFSSSYSAK